MQCPNHPAVEATTQCVQCLVPFCSECVNLRNEDKAYICHDCLAQIAFDYMDQDIKDHRSEREIKLQEKDFEKKAKKHQKIGAVVAILVFAVALNFILYPQEPIPDAETISSENNLLAAAIIIDVAISQYADDHGGSFPPTLMDLWDTYLPSDEIGPDILEEFHYTRPTMSSYELCTVGGDGGQTEDIFFAGGE